MADIVERIRRDVEEDTMLKVHALTVDTESKGFLSKRHILRIGGTVATEHEREKIKSIVNYHSGDAYQIEFNVKVEETAQA